MPVKEDPSLEMQFRSDHCHHGLSSPALHSDQGWTEPEVGSKPQHPPVQMRVLPGRCLQGSKAQSVKIFSTGSSKICPKSSPSLCCVSRVGRNNCLEHAGEMLFLTLSQTPTIFNSKRRVPICTWSFPQNYPEAGASMLPRASEMFRTVLSQLTGLEKLYPVAGTPINLLLAAETTDTDMGAVRLRKPTRVLPGK